MWAMMLCCALPFFILIFGLGGKALGASTWIIFGGIAVMIIAHLFLAGRRHKHSDERQAIFGEEGKDKNDGNNKNRSGHGCCH